MSSTFYSSTYFSATQTFYSASTALLSTEPSRTIGAIAAGDSGVPLSSSIYLADAPGAPLISATPNYKTVYVTKTAEPNSNTSASDLQPGAIAGIAIGGVICLALLVGLVYFLLRRRRRRWGQKEVEQIMELPSTSASMSSTVVAEKHGSDIHEAYGTHDMPIYEVSGKMVYELPASLPELDGKAFSMKTARSRYSAAMIATRSIMSRGRPVRPGMG